MYRIKSNAGESLVEVLVSMFLFLMMVAIMQEAISFCTNAQHKSEQIREQNAKICESVWEKDSSGTGGRAKFVFRAVSADGSQTGNEVFEIEADLGEKTVPYTDEEGTTQDYTFYVYMEQPAAGGGSP